MGPRLIQPCAAILLCFATSSAAQAEPCRSESFEGASYIVCRFDPTKDALRMHWRGDDGKPYRTFAALAADLEAKGMSLQFAMNGGMYQGDLRPVGLYIESGRELTPANTVTRTGAPSQISNFYKKPKTSLGLDLSHAAQTDSSAEPVLRSPYFFAPHSLAVGYFA
jgi:uncharacterized protein YigE (DUF2233 family)